MCNVSRHWKATLLADSANPLLAILMFLFLWFQIDLAVQGLDSLAKEASVLASQYTGSVALSEPGRDPPSALTLSAQVVVGLQQQALLLRSELQDSRQQLKALQMRSAQKEQSEEMMSAMAKAAEQQSELSLNDVSLFTFSVSM